MTQNQDDDSVASTGDVWEVPILSEDAAGDSREQASSPDAADLLGAPAQFWNEGTPITGAAPSGKKIPREGDE